MKEKIASTELQDFLKDFEQESNIQILEEGKEKNEILAIAEARGYPLKGSKDLSGFKTIYTFANKANKNRARLPKAKLLKALPTLIGKPVNIDHIRSQVVGHYIDYRYRQKEDMVIAYGVFYKSNFGKLWDEAKKLFKSKKLATSYEIWCPDEKRKKLNDGTYELQEIEIAGGALLFKEEPAFEDAKVLELAKKNLEKQKLDLVLAKKYKKEEIITSDYFLNEVRKNAEKLVKERGEQKAIEEEKKKVVELTKKDKVKVEEKKEEPKKEIKKEEKPKEEVKKDEKKKEVKEEVKKEEKVEPKISKIKCSNCSEEIDISEAQTELKCPKCFAILDNTGKMKYPPQIKDFKLLCPSCKIGNWLILENIDNKSKLRCLSCAKEYEVSFETKNLANSDAETLKDKISFLYQTTATCYQCGKRIPVTGVSTIDSHLLKCTRCGLEFTFDKKQSEKYRQIKKIVEITEDKKEKESSEKGGKEMDKEKVDKIFDEKVEKKIEEPKVEVKETPKVEEKKEEKASIKEFNAEEQPKESSKNTVQENMDKLFEASKELGSGKTWVENMIEEEKTKVEESKKTKQEMRGRCVFQSTNPKVTDNKDHFPINDANQARNALARVAQYDAVPKWYKGTLKALKAKVRSAVRKAYPSIKVTEKETASFKCSCVECGHKIESAEHCVNLKCPKCGGQMRRVDRPGDGKPEEKKKVEKAEITKEVKEEIKETPKVEDSPETKVDETAKYRKAIRKAVKKIINLKKESKLAKASKEDKEKLLKDGIKKVASQLIEARAEIKKIKSEADEKIKLYLDSAQEIIKRKTELGEDFAKDLSDKDILNDDKFAKAKLEKENSLLRAQVESGNDTAGDKTEKRDEEWYANKHKEIDNIAFGRIKKK